jgi:hypothetical protein
MKNFQDIPKKDLFRAPEGYFDTLPGKISARIEQTKPRESTPVFRYALQYALPVVVIAVVGILWFNQQESKGTEGLLASIETEELISYLAEADDLSYEEFINEMNPTAEEAEALQEAVFELQWTDENMDEILQEFDNQNL